MSSVQPLVDGWNSRDPEAVVAAFAPDGARHQFALEETRFEGHAGIRETVGAIMHSYPDCTLTVRGELSSGNRTALEWTFEATFQEDFGPMTANGERVSLPGISVLTIREDGLIFEERVYWDGATLMAAAGMIG